MDKIRVTGGKPLVRRGIMGLIEGLSRHLDTGALDELTLTTNGSSSPNMPISSTPAACDG